MIVAPIEPLPVDTPWAEIDLNTHSLTGWPKRGRCTRCGADAALLTATRPSADYECRGTPTDSHSAYGPDRCGAIFRVKRHD